MTQKTLIFAFLLSIFLSACEKDSFEDLYAGAWAITFDGSSSGNETIIIKSDQTFNFSIIVSQTIFGSVTNQFSGTVSSDGKIEGNIFMNGADIGDVAGTLKDDGTGSGVYATNVPTSGTWIAIKQ